MNCACFIDLGAVKLNYEGFVDLQRQAGVKFQQVKFYGYNAKKNGDFNAYIRQTGAEVALPLHNRKKVRVDIRQVIDCVCCACKQNHIDTILIACAEVDSLPMINAVKAQGKKVLLAVESVSTLADSCDGYFIIKKSASVESDKNVATSEDEFLPYTGLKGQDIEQMQDVKQQLQNAIEQKLAKKQQKPASEENDELMQLLKKYF